MASNISDNVWFNSTATAATAIHTTGASASTWNTADSTSSPTFPGGCKTTSTSCGPTHGCACRSWSEWQGAGKDKGSLWQQDPQLGSGPLRLVSSPAALALGIQPLTALTNAGADWEV